MHLNSILAKTLDLGKLIKKDPSLFDLSKLSTFEKLHLLRTDESFYKNKITLKLSAIEKYDILTNSVYADYRPYATLSDKELEKLNDYSYQTLIYVDSTYLKKERVEKLSAYYKNVLFLKYPEKIYKLIGYLPKLDSYTLDSLAHTNPKFLDKISPNWQEFTTNANFWRRMIKFNKKYETIFLDNMNRLLNKTELRNVITAYPHLIKSLTDERMKNSKLTYKEWVLLISRTISLKKNEKIFNGWEIPTELEEIIRLELTTEMLTSKSKSSKVFHKAMKSVFEEDEEIPSETEEEEL
jgi:hypothetical protein